MLQTLNIIMKTIEATTDSVRRRARRMIESFLRCAALTPEQQVLLGQLKRTLEAKDKSNVPSFSSGQTHQ